MKNILKLLNKREQKIFLENKNLANKLWKIIPESNKRPMGAMEVIDIVKKENSLLDINSICKKFNIVLKKNMKLKKYNSKSNFDGNSITIEYKDEKDIPEQLGHIFQNFLSSIYFQYPPKYNLKTIDLHEKKAKNFAIRLNLLIARYELVFNLKKNFEIINNLKKNFEIINNLKKNFEIINNLKKNFEIINNLKKNFEIINNLKKNFEIINNLKEYTNKRNNLIKKQYSEINKIKHENVKYNNDFYQAA